MIMAVMENHAYAQRAGAMIQDDAGPWGARNHDQLPAQRHPGSQPRLPDRSHPQALRVRVTAMANGTYTGTLASLSRSNIRLAV